MVISEVNMSPCKDCKERHMACHDNCQKYLDWKQGIDDCNKARRQQWEQRVKYGLSRQKRIQNSK